MDTFTPLDPKSVHVISDSDSPVVCYDCGSHVFSPATPTGYDCPKCGMNDRMGIDYAAIHGSVSGVFEDPENTEWFIATDRPRWHLGDDEETVVFMTENVARAAAAELVEETGEAYLYQADFIVPFGGIVEFDMAVESDEAHVAPDVAYHPGSAVMIVKRRGFEVKNRWKVTPRGAELKNKRK